MLRRLAGRLVPLGSAAASASAAAVEQRAFQRALTTEAGRTSAAPGGAGVLGGSAAAASTVMEEAAIARLKKIKSQLEATGELQQERPSTGVGAVLRVVWNTLLASTATLGAAAAYYTYFYTPREIDGIIQQARSSGGGGAEAAAAPLPPWTAAWADVLEWYVDVRRGVEGKVREFTDPSYDRLLPDLPAHLRGHVITLVLDLDDLLVYKEWTRQKGWSIYKRPGVQDFLLTLAQYYEVVVFTDEPATYADPILNKLDPHKAISFRLYRTDTQYHNGKHVRDLSKLNRDLTHVLMLSAKPEAYEFQPENALKLQAWKGQVGDTQLIDLLPFLQFLATRRIRDVREVVKAYDGVEDIPGAFRARLAVASTHQKQQQPRLGFLGPK